MGQTDTVAMILLSVVVAGAQPAFAQDGRWYAGVTAMFSTQDSFTPAGGSSIPRPGVGGSAVGFSGEFGAQLARTLGLALEVSVPSRFESLQKRGIPASQIDNQHRDLVFSGLLHGYVTPTAPIRIALLGGPSLVLEDTLQRTVFRPTGSGDVGAATSLTRWTVGLTVGADVGVFVSRHVQIVPQIRLHWVERASLATNGEADNASAFLALGSVVVRPGVGMRVNF
jgi:hypothetical protein